MPGAYEVLTSPMRMGAYVDKHCQREWCRS